MKIFICTITVIVLFSLAVMAQDKTTGGVKGTVRNNEGDKIAGVSVAARQNDKDVRIVKTDGKGEFVLNGLTPGVYRFVFNKDGLSESMTGDVSIKGGNISTLKRLVMFVDQGTLALIRGSIFDTDGRIVRGAKIEVVRVSGGNLRNMGEKFSDNNGEFSFRFPSEAARYRFTVSISGAETATKDLDVDGAEVYRFAVSLKAKN